MYVRYTSSVLFIYETDYSRERKSMIPDIYENIHESIYELVKQMEILSLEYDSWTSVKSAEHIAACGCNCPTDINEVS